MHARACSCAPPPVRAAIRRSSIIFAGHATRVEPVPGSFLRAFHFKVRACWKGSVPDSLVVYAEVPSACGYEFELGKDYLVYLRVKPGENLEARACTRTAPFARAEEDRRALGKPQLEYGDGVEVPED